MAKFPCELLCLAIEGVRPDFIGESRVPSFTCAYDFRAQMIFGSGSNALMNHDRYFAVFNMHTFLGDTISRKVAYYFPPAPVLSYVLIIIVGSVLSLLKMPILLWPGLFLIFFANGSIYATTTKHMDNTFKEGTEMAKYHLIALSVWLFVGDIGSVAGSNTWEYFQPILCDGVQTAAELVCSWNLARFKLCRI